MKTPLSVTTLGILLAPLSALPCMTQGKPISSEAMKKVFTKSSRPPGDTRTETIAKGHPKPSTAARMANLLLKHGKNAIISIPTEIESGDHKPYGNGQSNAQMTHGKHWRDADFIVYGVQISGKRQYHFHPSTGVKKWTEKTVAPGVYQVIPEEWNDSFHFDFNTGTQPVEKMVSGISPLYRTFAGGREAPDPAGIGSTNAFQKLLTSPLGEGYNRQAWFSHNVHARYPRESGHETAIGGALTWGITDSRHGPFKQFYTCLEGRKLDLEDMKGVPSGAGWHRIGDPGETIINNLDKAPLMVAVARATPKPSAYGMTEIITASWLKPSEAMTTRNGEFHWYSNPYEREFCAEVWAHKCEPRPTNAWGFSCDEPLPPQPDPEPQPVSAPPPQPSTPPRKSEAPAKPAAPQSGATSQPLTPYPEPSSLTDIPGLPD